MDTGRHLRKRTLGLLAAWAASIVAPGMPAHAAPSATPLVVSYPRAVLVVDPAETDDLGVIPVVGTVEAACFLSDRSLLLLHAPDAQSLHIVDVKPLSPSRFQALASYRSPELAERGLRFVQSGLGVYLAAGTTAVAIVDLPSLQVKLGATAVDFLPLVFEDHVVLKEGIFLLKDGQLSCENPRPRTGPSAPVFIPLRDRPLEMLADAADGKLYLSVAKPDGTGGIVVVEAASHRVTQEISVPWPISSMVWSQAGQLAILSGTRRRLGLYDLARQRWQRIWSPTLPGRPLRLLAVESPAVSTEVTP